MSEPFHTVADTARVAFGFALGGTTAIYFGLDYVTLLALTVGIVFLEVVYVMAHTYYEVWKWEPDK